MSMETVEVAIELNRAVVNPLLASAQSALLAQLKAAGNDLNALSTKAGASIAFLQITGARAGNALAFSMAVKTGKCTGNLFLTESRWYQIE